MMARSNNGGDETYSPSYEALRHIISELSSGDRLKMDIFVDAVEVAETYHDRVPYEETIKIVEARADLEGPRGGEYELTASRFSEHEALIEVRRTDGGGDGATRKEVSQIERIESQPANARPPVVERAQGKTPPDPSLPNQEEWTITTIAKRFRSRPGGSETVPCAATGEPVDLADIHYHVRARRDPTPHIRYSDSEHETWVVQDADALEAWFATSQREDAGDGDGNGNDGADPSTGAA